MIKNLVFVLIFTFIAPSSMGAQISGAEKAELFDYTLIHEGETSLYSRKVLVITGSLYYETRYFVQGPGKSFTKIFPVGAMGNGSDKAMKKYFKDCPKLVKLISQQAFKKFVGNDPNLKRSEKFRNRLIEMVKYYNSKCSKE